MANEDVERALMEALGMGQRPRTRPKGMSDSKKMMMMKGMSERPRSRPRSRSKDMDEMPELSPEDIKILEQMMLQQRGVQDKAERKAFPPPSMMENGGEVNGGKVKRKKKPKMGAVMKGRGGSYIGIK